MVTSQTGRILSIAGGVYRTHVDGDVVEASIRGRMKRGEQRVLVGDVVRVAAHDGGWTVEGVEPRRSVLQRRMPGRTRGVRAVASNVDRVIAVGATDRPAWDQHLMDRFVAVAEASALDVLVVINKVDLVEDADALARPFRTAGYEVLLTSVPRRIGIDALAEILRGATSLFAGPTGVGKSSLANAVQPGLELRTAEVSRRSRAGRHTTVAAEMHPLDAGGFVVDTPGLRDIGLWDLDPRDVAAAFPEFSAHAAACRFDDCRHVHEPDCAVAAAAESGEIDPSRLASYRRLLEEVEGED